MRAIVALRFKLPALFRRRGKAAEVAAAEKECTAPRRMPIPLAPVWLVAEGRDGSRSTWRINHHWDGRRTLTPCEAPAKQPCYLVLDGDLPFRRKLQRFPADRRARQALLRTAPDEFPLPQAEVDYALGVRQGDGYLYALPRTERTRWQQAGLNPAVVLVASEPLGEDACLAALESFERLGAVVAFGSAPRFVQRNVLRNGVLGFGALLGLALCVWLVAAPRLFDDIMEWQLRSLRREAGDLPRLYQAAEDMAATEKALASLRASPEAKAPHVLAKLMATIPPGVAIRRIEIAGGVLRVAGSGTEVQPWLLDAGFPASGINIEQIGSFSRFRAELTL
ncbi:MAG TPA: hypothetical protein VI279_11785 [Rhodocyclaceae bacterium]